MPYLVDPQPNSFIALSSIRGGPARSFHAARLVFGTVLMLIGVFGAWTHFDPVRISLIQVGFLATIVIGAAVAAPSRSRSHSR